MYLWDIDFDITEPKPVYDVNDEIKIELAGIDSGLKPKRCITFWKYVQQIWYLSPMLPLPRPPPPQKKLNAELHKDVLKFIEAALIQTFVLEFCKLINSEILWFILLIHRVKLTSVRAYLENGKQVLDIADIMLQNQINLRHLFIIFILQINLIML